MGQANRVKELIKQISNGENHEPFHVYLGTILTDEECSTTYFNYVGRKTCFSEANLTVAVKLVTDQSNNSGLGNTYGIVPNQTILPNVALMCDVDDGPYIIPAQGSNVIIGISGSLLPPFILQYSAVSGYNNSSTYQNSPGQGGGGVIVLSNGKGESFLVTKNNDDGNPISGSLYSQTSEEISIGISDGIEVSTSENGLLNVDETGENTTNYIQDINKIQIGKVNGATLQVDKKFKVAISDTINLTQILNDIKDSLNDIKTALTSAT